MAFALHEPVQQGYKVVQLALAPPVINVWNTLMDIFSAGQLLIFTIAQENTEAAAKNVELRMTIDDDNYADVVLGTGVAIDSDASINRNIGCLDMGTIDEVSWVNNVLVAPVYISADVQFPLLFKKRLKIEFCLRSAAGTAQTLTATARLAKL